MIRAAYRALLHKYSTPGRVPDDPVGDDARTRAVQGAYELLKDPEIRRAYDQHRRDRAQAAAEAAARAAPIATAAAEPLVLKPDGALRMPASRRRRSAAPLMVGLLLIAALGAGAYVLWRNPLPALSKFASSDSVAATPQKPAALEAASARPLPCYVDGHSVGDLPLKDCAGRNGVATGQLEAGLDGQPVKVAASPIAPERERAHSRHQVAENSPPPADLPEGDLASR